MALGGRRTAGVVGEVEGDGGEGVRHHLVRHRAVARRLRPAHHRPPGALSGRIETHQPKGCRTKLAVVARTVRPALCDHQLVGTALCAARLSTRGTRCTHQRTFAGALFGFFHGARLTKPKGKSAAVSPIEPACHFARQSAIMAGKRHPYVIIGRPAWSVPEGVSGFPYLSPWFDSPWYLRQRRWLDRAARCQAVCACAPASAARGRCEGAPDGAGDGHIEERLHHAVVRAARRRRPRAFGSARGLGVVGPAQRGRGSGVCLRSA